MRLAKRLVDPCIRTLLSRRLNCLPMNLDAEIEKLLKMDAENEFEDAAGKVSSFSLSSFRNSEKIEIALNEYVFLMALNEIYKNVNGKFLFDRITSGLTIENIAETVIRTRLAKEYSCKFIDTQGIDFAIFGKKEAMIAGVQCKALLEVGKSVLGIDSLFRQLCRTRKHFNSQNNVALALFCGYFYFPDNKRLEILRRFKKERWHVFRVFKNWREYSIDDSLHRFIEFVENIQ